MTWEQIRDNWLPSQNERQGDIERSNRFRYTAVSNYQVMAVAVFTVWALPNGKFTWRAYIGTVPGQDHSKEWWNIRRHGDLLSEKIARCIFPEVPEDAIYGEED